MSNRELRFAFYVQSGVELISIVPESSKDNIETSVKHKLFVSG